MQLFVKTLTGHTITLDVSVGATVMEMKLMLLRKVGVAMEQQSLIFSGRLLEDGRKLSYYSIQHEATIHMVLRLRGMISNFESDDGDSAISRFLRDEEFSEETLKAELQDLAREKKASLTKTFWTTRVALGSLYHVLIDFADKTFSKFPRPDLKILFNTVPAFSSACRSPLFFPRILKELSELHSSVGNVRFAIRRTMPHDGVIGFHVDGSYATKTAHVSLNDDTEYEGGRWVFYSQGECQIAKRSRGTVTVHSRDILHAVTKLTSGTRYSLFVVNKHNTLGENVVRMEEKDTEEILAQNNHGASVYGVAIHNKCIVSASIDKTVKVWNVKGWYYKGRTLDTGNEMSGLYEGILAPAHASNASNEDEVLDVTEEVKAREAEERQLAIANAPVVADEEERDDSEWWQPENLLPMLDDKTFKKGSRVYGDICLIGAVLWRHAWKAKTKSRWTIPKLRLLWDKHKRLYKGGMRGILKIFSYSEYCDPKESLQVLLEKVGRDRLKNYVLRLKGRNLTVTVEHLQSRLRKWRLKVSGRKKHLLARIFNHIEGLNYTQRENGGRGPSV